MKREIASASYEKEMHPIMLLFFFLFREKGTPKSLNATLFLKGRRKKKGIFAVGRPYFYFFVLPFLLLC